MELANKYNAQEVESKWQKYWEDQSTYKFVDSNKEVFSIDTPPPTVSGKMHLGHALSYSQQDFIARYKRMKGFSVFYPFGTDDNGLATEKLVQKSKGVNLRKIPRDEAIRICLEFLEEERKTFIADWKQIGMSCDFSLAYSTIDDHSRKISQRTFLELAKKGLVERRRGPVMWDRQFQTAIAQAELEDKKQKTVLSYVKAKLLDSNFGDSAYMIYATTRPEMLFACVGMSVEENGEYVKLEVVKDKEYWITGKATHKEKFSEYKVVAELKGKDLIGKKAKIAMSGNEVEISHDELVKADFGTGIVYYCTYGGVEDVEWAQRHKIDPIEIIEADGKMNSKAQEYEGKLAAEARKEIIVALEESKDLVRKENIENTVKVGERSGVEVEFIISSQWYVTYMDKKGEFLQAAKELKWHPEFMKERLDNWINGLNWDWGFSRQRHYGIPIPVWYDKQGKAYFAEVDELPIDPTKDRPKSVAKEIELIGEKDVFDTWFTSGSTPLLSTELVKDEKVRKKLFPMSLRPQAHDIINFWLFYTLAKTRLLYGVNPWKDVTISGWALDPRGKKMSKSKGNVIAPQVMIEKYSADALRFWSASSKLGSDLPFQEKDLVTGQKLVNKLWNASKFSLMHLGDYEFASGDSKKDVIEVMDQWLLSRLQKLVEVCSASFEKYEYSKAKAEVEKFFWQVFCDQYLEIVKDRLYNPDKRGAASKRSAQVALSYTLDVLLKLFAPFMPYITEEIFQIYFAKGQKSIHISAWPEVESRLVNENTEKTGDLVVDVINTVRRYKSAQQWSLKEELRQVIVEGKENELKEAVGDLQAVLNTNEVVFSGKSELESEKLKVKIGINK